MIPSPTIATFPFFFNARMVLSFPSGKTPAMTSSTPACFPIALAVRSLSPVSMTTWIPMFCNSRIACGLSSLITSATATTPANFPSFVKNNGVFPSSANASAVCFICTGTSACSRIKFRFPPASGTPSHIPVNPFPGTA